MSGIISLLITLLIIIVALKIALKVTGCLVKTIIFIVALWFILMALNYGFHFLSFLPFLY